MESDRAEKLYEKLMTEDEALKSYETDEIFIMLLLTTRTKGYDDLGCNKKVYLPDGEPLSRDKIKEMMHKEG